jgi:hypothetical protein
MYSRNLSKFGPEEVVVSPSCDSVQCSFDFKAALRDEPFFIKQLCKAGPSSFSQVAYEVSKDGRRIYVAVTESLGSGGLSTFITLFFRAPTRLSDFCSEAKRAE